MSVPAILQLADGLVIRPIEPRDNPQLTQIIITVWGEYDDTVYFEDPNIPAGLNNPAEPERPHIEPEQASLSHRYQTPTGQAVDRGYWVIEDTRNQRILGGGGFAPLIGAEPEGTVCELQKLYFLAELRGRGIGGRMMALLLSQAAQAGYREMYLESIPEMADAVHLYQKFGFRQSARKGTTGHWRCQIFMSRSLLSHPLTEPIPALPTQPQKLGQPAISR